jgi:hypothetical protein
MNRRQFLDKFRRPALAVAAVPFVAVATDKAHEATTSALKALKEQFTGVQVQCASLKDRMDGMEARQKKMMRLVLAAAALTVGVDISLLL